MSGDTTHDERVAEIPYASDIGFSPYQVTKEDKQNDSVVKLGIGIITFKI